MKFFKKFFNGNMNELDNGELSVLCPFPHKNENGSEYLESVPSAHINPDKSVFHCKVCGMGMSEPAFLAKMQGISYKDALKLLDAIQKDNDDWQAQRTAFHKSEPVKERWQNLGLSLELADQLQIGYEGQGISFPVFIYGELLDVRQYNPDAKPKVKSKSGAKTLLLPFDLWREDDRPTLLCAGEKDMAIAREKGFNALTFTGGEQAFPKLFKASFRGKRIYIVYDNDQAGHEGSRKVASLLKDCGAIPHVVTSHYSICTEKGEDIHDFFCKYGASRETLQKMLDETPEFSDEEHRVEQSRYIPFTNITEAMQGQFANRVVSSRVCVVATYEEGYQVPEYVEFTKYANDDKGTIAEGTTITWTLGEENAGDILYLMDSNLKEDQIHAYLKRLAHIPQKENFIRTTVKSRAKVHKAVVTDDLESEVIKDMETHSRRELLVYAVGEPVTEGKRYRMFWKPTAHPLKGAQIVGVITRLEDSDTSIHSFSLNCNILDTLKVFQISTGETVDSKINDLFERAKGIIGPEARKNIFLTSELFYHTPLRFQFGDRDERGYLDIIMIGDPRTGKSRAFERLMPVYELGMVTSLRTATKAGLIGGSDQTAGGWKTKLGLIPRSHGGALIMEEFSDGGAEMVSQLTEIRSSQRVRLARVNGSIDVPAHVRMIAISNPPKNDSGNNIPIKSYPSGVKLLLDLVGASEDIARYDFITLVEDTNNYISPLTKLTTQPYSKEAYQNRVRWVWSRKKDQIVFADGSDHFIWDESDRLNKEYDCHVKLFGPETWKKIARIAIACAGMVCSMSEDGEKLIVRKEHVEWAIRFLVGCYDNKLFRLKEYVTEYRKLNECDEAAVHALQGMFSTYRTALQQLEMSTVINQRDLQMVSGLDNKDFTAFTGKLSSCAFITYTGSSNLQPTQRFRLAMNEIQRDNYMKPIGAV